VRGPDGGGVAEGARRLGGAREQEGKEVGVGSVVVLR
jgi:hypothetical protein